MMTISASLAMAPAARMMCSRSERFIYAPSLPRSEEACKRRGLTQAYRRLRKGGHLGENFLPGPGQDTPPFFAPFGWVVSELLRPAIEGPARSLNELGVAGDL